MFKVTGITYLCQICAGLCRDAGYQAIAAQVELFGKVTILLAGMPVLLSLMDTITGFMK
ncbi:MAG: SpoIIIAC/SpoIIIAD family protein [Eisenbergiella sp.]